MTNTEASPYRATPANLGRAVLGATVAAAAILTLFVLPAEWGIDPTGAGRMLGLTRMANTAEAEDAEATAAPAASEAAFVVPPQIKESIQTTTPWRSDEKTLTLPPHSGIEVKAHMVKGDRLVFRWDSTGGAVRMDMHGEPKNGKEGEFSTYWKQKNMTEAQGSFTAAYDGTHGWYWRNGGEMPVSIKLKTAGFYKDLFQPPAE